jgi:hypothetical protein
MAVDTCYLNERVEGILDFFDSANQAQGLDMGGESGPGFVPVFPRERHLGVGERQRAGVVRVEIMQPGVMLANASKRGRQASRGIVEEFFCLLLILFEVGTVWENAVGHRKLLSCCAWTVRTDQAERRFIGL